jgi:two-component system sensor histidine kinase/response regulator
MAELRQPLDFPENPPSEQRVNILLVDDHPANLLALEAILQELGHNLVQARSGEEAVQRSNGADDFALVLLDVQMPGLDGFETARLIRGRDSSRHTPIIFLTAFESDRFQVERAYSLGAVDYIVKPLIPVIVRAKVAGFVELFQKTQQVKRQAERIRQIERREFEKRLAEENARLREQRELLRVTLASIGDAVIATDTEGRVTFLNPVAEALTGWAEGEAQGRPLETVFNVFHDQTRQPVEKPLAKVIRESMGVGLGNHTVLVARDGTQRPIDHSAAPIKDATGSTAGVVLIFRDITDRKRAEEELHQAKKAAESANRAKSEFLANMSHEIRTPMNGVLGMTELALDTNLTAEQREYMNAVKQSAEALLTVINDILDFSKIEAGRLDLDPVLFRLRDSLDAMLRPLALQANKKGLELAYSVRPNVPDALYGDLGRLRQVIINLVGNAIKFTSRGEVEVQVHAEAQTLEHVTLHVLVADTGIGIPADKLSTVFAPFVQADGSMARRYGGTGLGLTISGRLVEMMNGRIWVESTVGQGSTFHFTVRLSVRGEACPVPPLHEATELQGLPVLVVDDNATNGRILQEMLTHWGIVPTVANAGSAALSELQRASEAGAPFRIVLLDVTLPNMDALAVAEQVQQRSQAATTTVLMLSSADSREDAARFRELGITAYLKKPVKQSDLFDAIRMACAEATEDSEGQDRPDTAVTFEPLVNATVVRPLRILLAEDDIINQKVSMGSLEKAGHQVSVANNGREAVAALDLQPFDLVLMDLQMPEMDGLEATAAIREREKVLGRRTPIIALTAHAMHGDRERIMAAGMDGYVTKPIRQEELWKAIGECVPLVAGTEILPDGRADQTLDRMMLLARVGGNAKRLTEILGLFSSECPRLMEELHEAVLHRNAERIQWTAHTLKGTFGSLSASDAFAAALRLEELGCGGNLAGADAAFAVLQQQIHRLALAVGQFGTDLTS